MGKKRLVATLALALGMGVGVAAQAAPALADSFSSADASAFVADINALRASHGLGALSVSSSLIGMADNWAVHLSGVGSLSHNPNLASQAPGGWRLLGENVGVGPTVSALQAAFTASPEHYANMVDPRFSQIGVGVYVSSQGYMWVTEDYMEPPAAAPAPAPVAPAPRASAAPAPSPVSVRPVALTTPAPVAPVVHAAPVPAPVHPASVPAPVVHAATPVPPVTQPAPAPPAALRAKPAPAANQAPRPAAPATHRAPKVSSGGLGALIPAVSRYASHSRDTALLLLIPLGGLAWILPRRRPTLAPRGRIGAF